MGSLLSGTAAKGKVRFGGEAVPARADRRELAIQIAPFLRGRISAKQRFIASFSDAPDVLQFVNSAHAKELAFLGTSCPDHFIRTKIRPMFVPWDADEDLEALKKQIDCVAGASIATSIAPTIAHLRRRIRRRCAMPARRWC